MTTQQKFSRRFDELQNIVSFTHEFLDKQGVEPSLRYKIDLCVEELFHAINIQVVGFEITVESHFPSHLFHHRLLSGSEIAI